MCSAAKVRSDRGTSREFVKACFGSEATRWQIDTFPIDSSTATGVYPGVRCAYRERR